MANGRPQNAGEAIFGALSNTLLGLAQEYPRFRQQERENGLKDQMMQMNMQSAQREKMLFDQQIALGRINLAQKNAEMKKLMEEMSMTDEQKRERERLAMINRTTAFASPEVQGYLESLPAGAKVSFGDGMSFTAPESPDMASRGDHGLTGKYRYIYETKGQQALDQYIAAEQSGDTKTLSAKDQLIYDSYYKDYPKWLADFKWREYAENNDSSSRAASAYRSLLGIEGRALINVTGSKPDDYAKAAEQSGFLPQYAAWGGTRESVLATIYDRYRMGKFTEEERDKYIGIAEKEFSNIYNSALTWADMRVSQPNE